LYAVKSVPWYVEHGYMEIWLPACAEHYMGVVLAGYFNAFIVKKGNKLLSR
jgi:hypothetical protein